MKCRLDLIALQITNLCLETAVYNLELHDLHTDAVELSVLEVATLNVLDIVTWEGLLL